MHFRVELVNEKHKFKISSNKNSKLNYYLKGNEKELNNEIEIKGSFNFDIIVKIPQYFLNQKVIIDEFEISVDREIKIIKININK